MKLKKGDKVVVIAGSNKGKEGIINKILDNKVIVEGVNIVKKHLKPKNNNGNGEIVEREAPIHVSNVKVINNNKEEKAKVVKSEAKKETSKKKTTSKKEAK